MPHQPTYSEITDGFTNDTLAVSDATLGAPYSGASVPVRYVAAETRNIFCSSLTILQGHAQAFGILLPYDVTESEFYFYSFAAYCPAGLNFIPFATVVDAGIAPLNAVVPIQTVLPSHGRITSGFAHCHGRGVLQPAPAIPSILPSATSVLFGVICANNSGANATTNIRLSFDARRFDEPRYVTEAR